ncbi:MAG: hypothetical protein MJ003_04740 [Paludibacteraceae bacterium]|nr:hypothetical protein [Paludibacteraceae bacterium]
MEHNITVGAWRLTMIDSVKINKSVETLSDTAVIVLPGTYINAGINIEDKIFVGDEVEIKLGYDGDLKTEFKGYLKSIQTDDGSITLECEDALYMWRQPLDDIQLANVSLKTVLQKVCTAVNAATGNTYTVMCDYEFNYEKFTFYKANAIDVLKQVQEETKANIYFDGNVLHIHAPYSQIVNALPVIYDFAVNVEKSELKYIKAVDKNTCVEVSFHKSNGQTQKFTVGRKNGTKIQKTVSVNDEASAKRAAESEYSLWCYDGYEGSLTGWLIPFVEPAYKVTVRDGEYPQKTGTYYVIATEVSFSSSGGVRKVTLGRKIQ